MCGGQGPRKKMERKVKKKGKLRRAKKPTWYQKGSLKLIPVAFISVVSSAGYSKSTPCVKPVLAHDAHPRGSKPKIIELGSR